MFGNRKKIILKLAQIQWLKFNGEIQWENKINMIREVKVCKILFFIKKKCLYF